MYWVFRVFRVDPVPLLVVWGYPAPEQEVRNRVYWFAGTLVFFFFSPELRRSATRVSFSI